MTQHTEDKPIELYFWPTPNGWKISILLEELGVKYNVNLVNISEGDQFKPEFLAISPNNRMPAIVDPSGPNGEPISVFESGAIMLYLAEKYQKFIPTNFAKRIATMEWLFWQMGGLGPMAGQAHHFIHYAPEQIEYGINRYSKECTRLYGVMDKQLAKHKFLACDEYTIADIACYGWAKLWYRQNQDIDNFPNLARWLAELKNRPAVQKGMEVGKDLRDSKPINAETGKKFLFKQ